MGPVVLSCPSHYDQLVRVYAYKGGLEGLLVRNYAPISNPDYLICLTFLGLSLGKKTEGSMALTNPALANLALCLPLLYEAAQALIF